MEKIYLFQDKKEIIEIKASDSEKALDKLRDEYPEVYYKVAVELGYILPISKEVHQEIYNDLTHLMESRDKVSILPHWSPLGDLIQQETVIGMVQDNIKEGKLSKLNIFGIGSDELPAVLREPRGHKISEDLNSYTHKEYLHINEIPYISETLAHDVVALKDITVIIQDIALNEFKDLLKGGYNILIEDMMKEIPKIPYIKLAEADPVSETPKYFDELFKAIEESGKETSKLREEKGDDTVVSYKPYEDFISDLFSPVLTIEDALEAVGNKADVLFQIYAGSKIAKAARKDQRVVDWMKDHGHDDLYITFIPTRILEVGTTYLNKFLMLKEIATLFSNVFKFEDSKGYSKRRPIAYIFKILSQLNEDAFWNSDEELNEYLTLRKEFKDMLESIHGDVVLDNGSISNTAEKIIDSQGLSGITNEETLKVLKNTIERFRNNSFISWNTTYYNGQTPAISSNVSRSHQYSASIAPRMPYYFSVKSASLDIKQSLLKLITYKSRANKVYNVAKEFEKDEMFFKIYEDFGFERDFVKSYTQKMKDGAEAIFGGLSNTEVFNRALIFLYTTFAGERRLTEATDASFAIHRADSNSVHVIPNKYTFEEINVSFYADEDIWFEKLIKDLNKDRNILYFIMKETYNYFRDNNKVVRPGHVIIDIVDPLYQLRSIETDYSYENSWVAKALEKKLSHKLNTFAERKLSIELGLPSITIPAFARTSTKDDNINIKKFIATKSKKGEDTWGMKTLTLIEAKTFKEQLLIDSTNTYEYRGIIQECAKDILSNADVMNNTFNSLEAGLNSYLTAGQSDLVADSIKTTIEEKYTEIKHTEFNITEMIKNSYDEENKPNIYGLKLMELLGMNIEETNLEVFGVETEEEEDF